MFEVFSFAPGVWVLLALVGFLFGWVGVVSVWVFVAFRSLENQVEFERERVWEAVRAVERGVDDE